MNRYPYVYKIALFILFLGILLVASCRLFVGYEYRSQWHYSPDGPWTGPEFWANRLQDWQVSQGWVECLSSLPMRTLHLTTMRLHQNPGKFSSSVIIQKNKGQTGSEASAGFLLGAGRDLDYRAASLIHHAYGKQAGLYAGFDGLGRLFIRDFEEKEKYLAYLENGPIEWSQIRLDIRLQPAENGYTLTLKAVETASNDKISELVFPRLPEDRLVGNVALVSHAGYSEGADTRFAFKDWRISGSKLDAYPHRDLGPLVTAMYTLSRGVLKLTAQFMPLSPDENHQVSLMIQNGETWQHIASSSLLSPSFTAPFKIENWDHKQDVPFRIEYLLKRQKEKTYALEGVIKKDPSDKNKLVLLSLSCVEQVIKPSRTSWVGVDGEWYPWDWGILYPHADLVRRMKSHEPDILFFAGDQVYEGASPTRADREHAFLDYLYKWYLWCITNKELTCRIPSISIPDDHDVYHGNIWGAGGIATPPGLTGQAAQDSGGYKMSPEFVNMVQATQTSHLPDPYDPEPVEQGIGVYFTECNIGGLSLAVIEDRKFKSAPKDLLPDAQIINGWVQNPDWDVKKMSRIPNANLLGDRQLDFLENWAADWSNQTWMKAVLSQTLFSNVATLPKDSKSDGVVPGLDIPDPGIYVKGDKLVADFDSNGWPQIGRDKAIRKFRKAFAIHVVGDQHLANTSQYGIEEWRDSSFVIVSPATGNIFPRRWWPPRPGKNRNPDSPRYTGDFEDGFGNKITVYAIANPHKTTIHPTRHHELVTGYSVITCYKDSRDIELANWPYWADPEKDQPFPGWPVRINQLDNYGKSAQAWLPEIKITGITNPVLQIIKQETGKIVYTLRIRGQSFQPKIFAPGLYTLRIGEPDTNTWQELKAIRAKAAKDLTPIDVVF